MKETRNVAKTEEYKIGLDLSFIDYNSQGGQAYFCYNLLKGLYEIQCDSNVCRHFKLTVFCTKNVSEKVMQVCPSAKIVYTKEFEYSVEKLISFYVSRTMYRDMVLPQIIKKEALDVIFFPHDMVAMFNHYKRIRTICNSQDVGPLFDEKKKKLKSKLFSMFTKFIYMQDFKHFDRIVALSKDDEKSMRQFIPKEKIVQIYNPIDMEPQYIDKSEHKEKIIAALNLVYEHKNCITLVKAFEKIQDKIPHNLVIMGRINEKSYQYAEEHDLLERIIFTGVVTDEERDRILCSCELYVSPTAFEGFGMTNVEAVFKGAITLLSDLPVNREVVGDAAVYYEPVLDENALANKILEVLQNDEYKLTVEKQKALVWKYSCKNIAEQYLELLMPQ